MSVTVRKLALEACFSFFDRIYHCLLLVLDCCISQLATSFPWSVLFPIPQGGRVAHFQNCADYTITRQARPPACSLVTIHPQQSTSPDSDRNIVGAILLFANTPSLLFRRLVRCRRSRRRPPFQCCTREWDQQWCINRRRTFLVSHVGNVLLGIVADGLRSFCEEAGFFPN